MSLNFLSKQLNFSRDVRPGCMDKWRMLGRNPDEHPGHASRRRNEIHLFIFNDYEKDY